MRALCLSAFAVFLTSNPYRVLSQNALQPFSDTISREELIEKYDRLQDWQKRKREAIETYGERDDEMVVGTLLTGCKELEAGKWVANWIYEYPLEGPNKILSIRKLYLKDSGVEDNVMMNIIRNKYASGSSKRQKKQQNSVPARWVNGIHGYIKHPIPYCGYWVSDEAGWDGYKEGVRTSWGNMGVGKSYYLDCAMNLRRVLYTENCIFPVYILAVQLLNYDADVLWRKNGPQAEAGAMDVLLYVDKQGKNRVECLSPKQPGDAQAKFMRDLETMLNLKGKNALPSFYTSDGRVMTGHYIKIVLGRTCILRDYVEDEILKLTKLGKN